MTPIPLLAALLLQADAPGPPEVWYQQAMGCGAALAASFPPGGTPDKRTAEEMLLWGFIVADAAPKAGRTKEQVDGSDSQGAIAFFRRIKAERPAAFKAHLAYCRALTRKG
jgi:hypothetical protein